MAERVRVLVLCVDGSPALDALPEIENVELVVCTDASRLLGSESADAQNEIGPLDSFTAVLYVPPADPAQLCEVWKSGKLQNIKWVHSFSAGVDKLRNFIAECLLDADGKDNGIPLTNGRGAFSSSLAEFVFCAALHFKKQVPRCQELKRSANWNPFVMQVLRGRTMAFAGFGNIARATAQIAKAFGMRVVALRRSATVSSDDAALLDAAYTSEQKHEMLAAADFVVSSLPGTPETVDFFDAAAFGSMKRSAVFISVGRGTVVDEDALVDALENNAIAGAALDVYKSEPLARTSRLWECDKLLMTHHNADYTEDYFALGWSVWRENLECFLRGASSTDRMATPVDKLKGY
uniref:D-isomer specific 2-hydroxyacid dehydrogenase NAD-binding domain-containing protein n=1 Tax=Erythrolobus australicus TaxID=1077150 RepID=A0A7S1XHW9_9RHOD|mmetsp:Transcript_1772/g.4710  ORF Transcript_1772/g.4710 Transcript_1772/m.4710 type:complete len:350 (+) Transcript_1772:1107-2156(+)